MDFDFKDLSLRDVTQVLEHAQRSYCAVVAAVFSKRNSEADHRAGLQMVAKAREATMAVSAAAADRLRDFPAANDSRFMGVQQ